MKCNKVRLRQLNKRMRRRRMLKAPNNKGKENYHRRRLNERDKDKKKKELEGSKIYWKKQNPQKKLLNQII